MHLWFIRLLLYSVNAAWARKSGNFGKLATLSFENGRHKDCIQNFASEQRGCISSAVLCRRHRKCSFQTRFYSKHHFWHFRVKNSILEQSWKMHSVYLSVHASLFFECLEMNVGLLYRAILYGKMVSIGVRLLRHAKEWRCKVVHGHSDVQIAMNKSH